jgi:hypothetical protein
LAHLNLTVRKKTWLIWMVWKPFNLMLRFMTKKQSTSIRNLWKRHSKNQCWDLNSMLLCLDCILMWNLCYALNIFHNCLSSMYIQCYTIQNSKGLHSFFISLKLDQLFLASFVIRLADKLVALALTKESSRLLKLSMAAAFNLQNLIIYINK